MSNFGSAEAGNGGYPAPAGGYPAGSGGYPAPSTNTEAPSSNQPAATSNPSNGGQVQQQQEDTIHNDTPDSHAPPVVPVGRLPLDPVSSLLRSLAFICFMLFGGACMYALVTPYWYSSTTATDTGTVISPFYSCVRSPGNDFSCTALTLGESRISVFSSGCATSADDTAMWMYIIRACVLLAGGAAGITAIIIIVNLAVYPVAKAPLAILAIVGGGISSLGWAGAVATTVIGISDKLVCGKGLCGTDASCSESWMSAAWVLFISGAFTVGGFAVVLIDYILRVMKKPKGAVPPVHHQQPAPSQQANTQQQQAPIPSSAHQDTQQQANGAASSQATSQQQPQPSQQQQAPQQQGEMNEHPASHAGATPMGQSNQQQQEPPQQHQPDTHAYPSNSNDQEQELQEVAPPVSEEVAADGSQYHHEGFELPEGDWVWDPASNMYWSESQYLFLNPQNSHFYDPNSNKWYNPETEVWYDEGEQ